MFGRKTSTEAPLRAPVPVQRVAEVTEAAEPASAAGNELLVRSEEFRTLR